MKWAYLPSLPSIYVVMKTNWFMNVKGVFFCTVLLYKSMHIHTQHHFFDTCVKKWSLPYYFLILRSRGTITLVDTYVKSKGTDYLEYPAFIVFSLEASWVQHSLPSKRLWWKRLLMENWKVPNGLRSVSCLGRCWCYNPGRELVFPESPRQSFSPRSSFLDWISFGSSIIN